MKRRFYFLSISFLLFNLFSIPLFGQTLVHGAGTLPKRTWGFTLNAGMDVPETLIYSVRVDHGVTGRFQLGLGCSSLFLTNTFSAYSKFNFWKTGDNSDFISVYFDPSVDYVALTVWSFLGARSFASLKGGLSYEHRFSAEKEGDLGLYIKAGIVHFIGLGHNFGDLSILSLFKEDTTAVQAVLGLQRSFGRFSLLVEPMIYIPFNNKLPPDEGKSIGAGGKMGFSWVF